MGSAGQRERNREWGSTLTRRNHRAARENGHAHEETGTDNPAPPSRGREKEREPSLTGGTHLLGDAGVRARPG